MSTKKVNFDMSFCLHNLFLQMKCKLFFFYFIITTSAIGQYNPFSYKADRQKEKISCSLAIDSVRKINVELKDSMNILIQKNNLLSVELNKLSEQNTKLKELQLYAEIGEQFWQKSNLAVKELTNGTALVFAQTKEEWDQCFLEGKPAFCYHKNDTLRQNGMLYNMHALNSGLLAPKNFVIPSKTEVETLIQNIERLNKNSASILKSKAINDWSVPGIDLFGMNIKPEGFRLSDGNEWYDGDKVYFYCQTGEKDLTFYVISEFSEKIYFLTRNKLSENMNYGMYVRCLKK